MVSFSSYILLTLSDFACVHSDMHFNMLLCLISIKGLLAYPLVLGGTFSVPSLFFSF
jgi:hypothetical protein